jgi:hypothetical protein
LIFFVALVIIFVPLPHPDTAHLMTEAEANDKTLVIVTTESQVYLTPLVEQFISETSASVRVDVVEELSEDSVRDCQGDLVLAHRIEELLPLINAQALDTLPLDIMWNIDQNFRDPAERWVGFTGRYENNAFTISALALVQQANSKPLAERFVLYLYSRTHQQTLVEHTGHYSLLAFGINSPDGLPALTEVSSPAFGSIYNSDSVLPENEIALKH